MFDEHLSDYAKAIGDAVLATDAAYQDKPADGTETIDSTESTDVAETNKGQILSNPVIENVESLDATSQDWGQGTNVDEKNRPTGATSAQEKYGKYNAYFIGEDTNTIYLTFDEGYEYGQTESILNTLKRKRCDCNVLCHKTICGGGSGTGTAYDRRGSCTGQPQCDTSVQGTSIPDTGSAEKRSHGQS